MQCIFKDERRGLASNDERRGLASFWPNPGGTGRIIPPAVSRTACVGPATRRRPLLTGGIIRSRLGGILIGHRP